VNNAEQPTRPDFSNCVGDASLAYRPGPRTTLRVEGTSRPGFSLYADATYLFEQRLTLGGLHYLAWPVGIEASVTGGRLTFPGANTTRVDRFENYDLGIRLRLSESTLGRRVEYSLKLEHEHTESNVEDANQDHTTLGFGAVIGYGR
jgi:hypothetical protein